MILDTTTIGKGSPKMKKKYLVQILEIAMFNPICAYNRLVVTNLADFGSKRCSFVHYLKACGPSVGFPSG